MTTTKQSSESAWTVDECEDANGYFTVRPADGSPNGNTDAQPIATVYSEANARLIAASPDFLAACEGVLAMLELLNAPGTHDPIEARVYQARAAIALAKGQP